MVALQSLCLWHRQACATSCYCNYSWLAVCTGKVVNMKLACITILTASEVSLLLTLRWASWLDRQAFWLGILPWDYCNVERLARLISWEVETQESRHRHEQRDMELPFLLVCKKQVVSKNFTNANTALGMILARDLLKASSSAMQLTFTISSYVSSSISAVVTVSSTWPRIILRCWSYACSIRRCSKASEGSQIGSLATSPVSLSFDLGTASEDIFCSGTWLAHPWQ